MDVVQYNDGLQQLYGVPILQVLEEAHCVAEAEEVPVAASGEELVGEEEEF